MRAAREEGSHQRALGEGEKAPWVAIFPGLAISLAVFGFNLFGDSLRDALDPKLRHRT
jgi:ABC-type dipeptide/oligopeptide/nickel transport system permease subunit